MTMLDQLPGIGFISCFFRAFDRLDAVIIRWMCDVRFRG
jgi:hypothetical protein